MKWFDLLIDSGREAYIPWRILHGEHLGRDFIHPYGPFSAYFNAGLFAVFGVSLRTLAWANLVLYAVITILAFRLLRRGFGFAPAAAATAFGIAVFGFGHHLFAAAYTFAAPYSHEATHGMLLFLLLLAWLAQRPSRRLTRAIPGGCLIGVLWLTKTEYVFASVLVLLVVLTLSGRTRADRRALGPWVAGLTIGGLAVFLTTGMALTWVTDAPTALRTVTSGVLAPFYYPAYSNSAHVLRFLGADRPLENLQQLAGWGVGAGIVLGGLALALRRVRSPIGALALAGGAGLLLGYRAWETNGWQHFGWMLPTLLVGAITMQMRETFRSAKETTAEIPSRSWVRLILLVAAAGMLARMALAPKLHHYGFFQAYLAALVIVAFFVGAWPQRVAVDRPAQRALAWFSAIVALAVAASAVRHSLWAYGLRTTPVGTGADQALAYRQEFYPFTDPWEKARQLIVSSTPPEARLLVIPEGLTLNYWTRRKHPLRIMDLLPATLRLNPGDVVAELQRDPPEMVVFITRDNMQELGYPAYGHDDDSGRPLVQWVQQHYTVVAQGGGSPFEPGQMGIQIWQRK